MLTPEDLTVIRAALRYFNEELIPHCPEGIEGYLDEPLSEDALTDQSVTQLRNRLASCDLRWAHYLYERGELLDGKLLKAVPDTPIPVATVLIPSETQRPD